MSEMETQNQYLWISHKAHMNSYLMSKHTFLRSTNSMGAIPNLYLEPTSWNSKWMTWNFVCLIVSINHHEKFVLRVGRPIKIIKSARRYWIINSFDQDN